MRSFVAAVTLVLVALAGPLLAAPTQQLPACVLVSTESRYVPFGYNHVVTLRNGCSRVASCAVSTDVNPEKQTVEVPPSTAVEVLTFMGSPSQTFVAKVSCSLK